MEVLITSKSAVMDATIRARAGDTYVQARNMTSPERQTLHPAAGGGNKKRVHVKITPQFERTRYHTLKKKGETARSRNKKLGGWVQVALQQQGEGFQAASAGRNLDPTRILVIASPRLAGGAAPEAPCRRHVCTRLGSTRAKKTR